MNFLLKHVDMLSDEDMKSLQSNTSEAKVIRFIRNSEACDLKPTLSNQLLVYQVAQKHKIDFSKLDQKFRAVEAVLKSKDEQAAFLKEHYEEMKQDADYTVVLACMIINTNSQNEYKLSEQQQHEIDENYYYLKYRLNESGENARQFNKNI